LFVYLDIIKTNVTNEGISFTSRKPSYHCSSSWACLSNLQNCQKSKIKVMFKTQLVSTKGDVMRTFISSSRPQTRFGSEGVEINYMDSSNSFTIMGSFNVIIEEEK
jgi:hypothetical protein